MRRESILLFGAALLAVFATSLWTQDSLVNSYAALSPHVEKARKAFRADRLDKCEKEARFCLDKLPEHHESHFLMALVLYKRGAYAEALGHVEAAEPAYLKLVQALAAAARQGLQKQTDDMVRLTDEVEDLAGQYAASKSHGSGMGESYDRALLDAKQDLAKAEGERNKAASRSDASAVPALYRYWHGNVLFMLGRAAEAEAQYRRAIATDPDFTETYNNLINLLYSGGRVDEARAALAEAEAHKAKVHPGLKKAVLEARGA